MTFDPERVKYSTSTFLFSNLFYIKVHWNDGGKTKICFYCFISINVKTISNTAPFCATQIIQNVLEQNMRQWIELSQPLGPAMADIGVATSMILRVQKVTDNNIKLKYI